MSINILAPPLAPATPKTTAAARKSTIVKELTTPRYSINVRPGFNVELEAHNFTAMYPVRKDGEEAIKPLQQAHHWKSAVGGRLHEIWREVQSIYRQEEDAELQAEMKRPYLWPSECDITGIMTYTHPEAVAFDRMNADDKEVLFDGMLLFTKRAHTLLCHLIERDDLPKELVDLAHATINSSPMEGSDYGLWKDWKPLPFRRASKPTLTAAELDMSKLPAGGITWTYHIRATIKIPGVQFSADRPAMEMDEIVLGAEPTRMQHDYLISVGWKKRWQETVRYHTDERPIPADRPPYKCPECDEPEDVQRNCDWLAYKGGAKDAPFCAKCHQVPRPVEVRNGFDIVAPVDFKHTTLDRYPATVAGLTLLDEEPGITGIYLRDADGGLYPCRTVSRDDMVAHDRCVAAWLSDSKYIDNRDLRKPQATTTEAV